MSRRNPVESIVKPRPMHEFSRKLLVYIPMDSPRRLIGEKLEALAIKKKKTPYSNLFLLENKTVIFDCVSAPLAALSLEPLIAAGAEKILLLGFCGSLTPEHKIGDAVSIIRAYSEEGTSRHYRPRRRYFEPSKSLRNQIENTLRQSGLAFNQASVVSTDAPYRESLSWLVEKRQKHLDCVDMEASAVFSVSDFYGLDSAALMIVSDEISPEGWSPGFHKPEIDDSIKNYFFPLIESLEEIV